MLEWTLVVTADALPAAARESITAAAEGATIGRIEHIEMHYTTRDGKVVKLPEAVTQYAAELSKGGQVSEVVVNPDGSIVEAPSWPKPATKPDTKSRTEPEGMSKTKPGA